MRKETQYAWECVQKECQKVLAMLLHGQAAGAAPPAAGAASKGKAVHKLEDKSSHFCSSIVHHEVARGGERGKKA